MRIVIFGAGAVGSVVGGRLHQGAARHGHHVALVARGPHRRAIDAGGLVLNDHAGSVRIDVPVVERVDEIPLDDGDVVMLTMKTQDTPAALEQLARHAPPGVHVVCAQNGVENERLALRRFERVHGMCVMLPATFLEPGVVDAHGGPHNAILDLGRYPAGEDDRSRALAAALTASDLASRSRPDIMRWKYRKLLMNLRNAVDALVLDPEHAGVITDPVGDEASACLRAAGIDAVTPAEDAARREGVMEMRRLPGGSDRAGNSTWQSFARGSDSTEVDWLNGEIVLLGRLHGVPTPMNDLLCRVSRWAIRQRLQPRSLTVEQILHWSPPAG